jgi:uncharacterized protein YndB with AHSA1/START domain
MNITNDLAARPSRREFALHAAGSLAAFAITGSALALAQGTSSGGEISHDAESIHQEVVFKAARQRVYDLLTDAKQFDRVVRLSDAMKGGMPPNPAPTAISREAGGVFTTFAGIIGGRHIELVPGVRVVQAWRPAHWKPGVYSIARFELVEQGAGTKLVLDHTGFPKGEAQSLSDGWHKNYWEPMAKALA